MAIIFPTPTYIGEQFSSGGKVWQWNGFAWDSIGGPGTLAPVYQATYYKSANQNLVSGSTDITFDQNATWNNANNYIIQTAGSSDFTVIQPGFYQLEFNASIVANGSTWNTANNKAISIDITRSPVAEQIVINQSAVMASSVNYSQNLCSSVMLKSGDVINLRVFGLYSSAIPFVQCIQNTYDLNTWFSWRLVF